MRARSLQQNSMWLCDTAQNPSQINMHTLHLGRMGRYAGALLILPHFIHSQQYFLRCWGARRSIPSFCLFPISEKLMCQDVQMGSLWLFQICPLNFNEFHEPGLAIPSHKSDLTIHSLLILMWHYNSECWKSYLARKFWDWQSLGCLKVSRC